MFKRYSLFVITVLFAAEIYGFSCPDGYDQITKEDVCVLKVDQPSFYTGALRHCASMGGVVMKIQNIYENIYVQALSADDPDAPAPYIGIEKAPDNTWIYSDGTPLEYQKWAPDEPNVSSNSSLCAILSPENGLWYSAECGFIRPFFCSFDGDGLQCPSGWIYSKDTDYCYFLQNFTYPDSVHWQLYNFSTAEANCARMNSHLASIHSDIENNFVCDLIYSNLRDEKEAAPEFPPCSYVSTYIGLVGNGAIGNGSWTDGSLVDYTQWKVPYDGICRFAAMNDPSCNSPPSIGWGCGAEAYSAARYVCKMPSSGRIRRESFARLEEN